MKRLWDTNAGTCYFVLMNLILALLTLCCFMPEVPHIRPEMVLLCENDPDDAVIERHLLQKYHCIVTECFTGTDAVALICENHYDYAFIDFWLNGTNGLEVVRQAEAKGPKKSRMNYYVISGHWNSKNLLDTMLLAREIDGRVAPIVKGMARSGDLRNFAAQLKHLSFRLRGKA